MNLEQTIQRSNKGSGGVIEQTKHEALVTEWELAYHEVLAISKCHKDITGSLLANSEADLPHRELTTRSVAEYNEAVNKVITFVKEKGNSYITSANTKLHHFTPDQLVPISSSDKLINYFDQGQAEYESFKRERFITKEKKLGDAIKRVKLPSFLSKIKRQKDNKVSVTKVKKATEKLLTKSTKDFDIAK